MDKMEQLYKQLTNIDLDEQKRIWDERGRGYYGEYQVFKELYLQVRGNCKYLMNLHVPTESGYTTEIDLLMIHETGVYVFEVKHYKGTIYGDDDGRIWTQYFHTTPNHKFDNPVLQNGYHIRALKYYLPDIPLFSVVVFSNEECDVRVNNKNPHLLITPLYEMMQNLSPFLNMQTPFLDMDGIDLVFGKLMSYSPLQIKTIHSNDKEIPFYEYIHSFKNDVDQEMNKAITSLHEATERANTAAEASEKQKKKEGAHWWLTLIASLLCFSLIIGGYCFNLVYSAQKELQEMENRFLPVSALDDKNIHFANHFIKAEDVKFSISKDSKDTVLFSCALVNIGEDYGISLKYFTKYKVLTEDGRLYEYEMFGINNPFGYGKNYMIGGSNTTYKHSIELTNAEFYGIASPEQIKYIKITGVTIWKSNVKYEGDLADVEIELYSK